MKSPVDSECASELSTPIIIRHRFMIRNIRLKYSKICASGDKMNYNLAAEVETVHRVGTVEPEFTDREEMGD